MPSVSHDTFVSLVVQTRQRVHRFVAGFISGRADIDDVVQNTFVTAWKKLETFQYSGESPDPEFMRWVCTIAKFESLAYRRKLKKTSMQFNENLIANLADMQLAEYSIVSGPAHLPDRASLISDCIEKLPTQSRELIEQRYRDEVSVIEISSNRGVSRQTVSKWFAKIRDALTDCMQDAIVLSEVPDA